MVILETLEQPLKQCSPILFAESGIITVFNITASSPIVDDINMFIADLMAMDIFESVDYTGYVLQDDETTWQINVVCTLAGQAQDTAAEGEVN